MTLRKIDERAGEPQRGGVDLEQLVLEKEAEITGHLIVA